MSKILPPEVLMADLCALIEEGQTVPLTISGGSMTPFLVHRRDTVYLAKPHRPLKRGDMVLYRRETGAWVLHRIYRAGQTLTLVGDAQTQLEPGIRREQVAALVTAVRRKGRLLKQGSALWFFFETVWIRLVPLRPWLIRLYTLLRGRRAPGQIGDSIHD